MSSNLANRGPYPDGALSQGFVTFVTELTSDDLGAAVMASGNYTEAAGITVAKATNGSQVIGKLMVVESDGYCSIDPAGSHFREYEFVAGATPTAGQGIQGGTTAGKVKGVAIGSGGRGLVVSVDESNLKVLVLV